MTLRQDLIRLANENPALRSKLVPLLRREAGYGVFPKVFLHAAEGGRIWLWTSEAGFGRLHHITGNLKAAEKVVDGVTSQVTQWFDLMGWSTDAWDIHHEPRASTPREMITSRSIRLQARRGATPEQEVLQELKALQRKVGLAGFKPIPS